MDNMEIFNKVSKTPNEAKKTIQAGRLKGMTDINPMFRIKKLTEVFGACGIGWYTNIVEKRFENGSDGTIAVFLEVALFIKDKISGEFSMPIMGTGGSMFVAKEKNGLYTSDEAIKMAYTDAISNCCKMLGFSADVYYAKDRSKYDSPNEDDDSNEDNSSTPKEQKISIEQIKTINEMCKLTNTDVSEIINFVNANTNKSYSDISQFNGNETGIVLQILNKKCKKSA